MQDVGSLIRNDSVHRSIYTDQHIFDMEMDLIFNKTWVFLAHACEIAEEGDYNSNHFRCPYHSWTYDNSGNLIGVPMPQRYGKSFDRTQLGLTRVPLVVEYQGFIFGCMTELGPTREEHLGGITKFLEAYVA